MEIAILGEILRGGADKEKESRRRDHRLQPLALDEIEGIERVRDALDGDLGGTLGGLLSRAEVRATARRTEALLAGGCFPFPSPDWPAIPWPPFCS